jgi:hypothetical protein
MKEIVTGVCEVCGIHWEQEPHDHRAFKTHTPEEALNYWRNRASQPRRNKHYV